MSAATHTTVHDREGLLRLFRELVGRKLIGTVDGHECVELVFDDPAGQGGNLVTISPRGRAVGLSRTASSARS
jgi:hypothetical protein